MTRKILLYKYVCKMIPTMQMKERKKTNDSILMCTHQSLTKDWKSREKPMLRGSRGGSSCSTLVRTSKSVLQFL